MGEWIEREKRKCERTGGARQGWNEECREGRKDNTVGYMGGSEGGRKGVGRKEMMERGMQRPAVGGGVQHQLLG